MWMMGYSDGGDLNVSDSFNSRKLRPLIPRPAPAASTNHTSTTNTPCLSRIHGTDLLALNHHLVSTMADQSKREFTTQQVVVSSRWNPTPEQLQTLEELYRQGTRTPSAEQIQHITAQLRRYGKIEGKNVFYWFQNHKARERQKRRRKLESAPDEQYRDFESTERKESGANRTVFDGVEQTKNWETPTNYSTISEAEKTVSIQRTAAAKAALMPECRTDGWVQFDGRELQHRRSLVERNATWRMMQLPCSPPTHFVNSTCSAVTTTTEAAATTTAMDPKHVKSTYHHQDLNIFLSPYTHLGDHDRPHLVSGGHEAAGCGDSQTLQLFPLRSGDGEENFTEKEMMGKPAMNSNFTPYQFFEFLPLKN